MSRLSRISIRLPCLFFVAVCTLAAAEPPLRVLTATLNQMRGRDPDSPGPRGASPPLTMAKHQLREWVESRLKTLTMAGDEAQLAKTLNNELKAAKLSCDGNAVCAGENAVGYLGELKMSLIGKYLLLQTQLGILCGHDESAYLYNRAGDEWHLFWQTEQNDYREGKYRPQRIEKVLLADQGRPNDVLILTLGWQPWCSSNWHDVYFRAFRPGPTTNQEPIIEGAEYAFLAGDHWLDGSVEPNGVLVQYSSESLDAGVLIRKVVRRYKVEPDSVERIDPIALSPRDFVDEWRRQNWNESAAWTEQIRRAALENVHKKLPRAGMSGEYGPTLRCASQPDLWQVEARFPDVPTPYFLIRWRPPDTFRMVDITSQPTDGCKDVDKDADVSRTLFPP